MALSFLTTPPSGPTELGLPSGGSTGLSPSADLLSAARSLAVLVASRFNSLSTSSRSSQISGFKRNPARRQLTNPKRPSDAASSKIAAISMCVILTHWRESVNTPILTASVASAQPPLGGQALGRAPHREAVWKKMRRPQRIESSTVPFPLGSLIDSAMRDCQATGPMEPPQRQSSASRPLPSSLSSWRSVLLEAGCQDPKNCR